MCKNTIWLPVSQILRITAQNSPSYSFFFTAALTVKIFPPLARARPALQIYLVFYAYLGTVAVRLVGPRSSFVLTFFVHKMAGGKKTVRSKVASGSSQSRQKPATLSSDVACAVCSKVVTESTPSCRGDDALQCDGCHLWFHRWCTGVSTCHYSSLSVSDVPFLCFVCLQKEFISLRDTVSALRLESAQLKSALSDIEANSRESTRCGEFVRWGYLC